MWRNVLSQSLRTFIDPRLLRLPVPAAPPLSALLHSLPTSRKSSPLLSSIVTGHVDRSPAKESTFLAVDKEKEEEEEERKVRRESHLGIFVHASDPTHSGPSLVIPCSTVLMTVPFFHCVAPGLLALSPYWDLLKDLHATVQATRASPQQLEVGNDATMVTTAVALHLADSRSPLHRYLREVCDPPRGVLPPFPSCCSSAGSALQSQGVWQDSRTMMKLQRELPPAYQEPFGRLRRLMSEYLSALHQALVERHTSLGSRFPCPSLQDLHLAHALCESRCLQVPSSSVEEQQQQQPGDERDADKATSSTATTAVVDDVFQGPTLVPGIDLLNHASLHEEPNVAVALVPTQVLVEEMAVPRELLLAQGTSCPLYVVALATRDLQAGEELRYHYVDPADDDDAQNALFWALRFHFLPDHLR